MPPACESRSNLILSRQESQVHSVWRDKEGRGLWVQDQGQCPQVHQACGEWSGPLSAGSWFHCWEIRMWVDTQTIWTLIRDPRRGTLYSGFSGKQTGNLMVLEAGRRWEKCHVLSVRCLVESSCFISWVLISALWCSYTHSPYFKDGDDGFCQTYTEEKAGFRTADQIKILNYSPGPHNSEPQILSMVTRFPLAISGMEYVGWGVKWDLHLQLAEGLWSKWDHIFLCWLCSFFLVCP